MPPLRKGPPRRFLALDHAIERLPRIQCVRKAQAPEPFLTGSARIVAAIDAPDRLAAIDHQHVIIAIRPRPLGENLIKYVRVPPLVPRQREPLYFVLCDYGPRTGRAYYETDPDDADLEAVPDRLMHGEYTGPIQVLEVDLPNGTARDVSVQFAESILQRRTLDELAPDVAMFFTLRAGLTA